MMHKVRMDLASVTFELELDDMIAPNTVGSILDLLPVVTPIHVWGEELYTDPLPIKAKTENSKSLVEVNDIAFWPQGSAICLFFGPTPISGKNEIKPYSPVNVIGKIKETNKNFIKNTQDDAKARFY